MQCTRPAKRLAWQLGEHLADRAALTLGRLLDGEQDIVMSLSVWSGHQDRPAQLHYRGERRGP